MAESFMHSGRQPESRGSESRSGLTFTTRHHTTLSAETASPDTRYPVRTKHLVAGLTPVAALQSSPPLTHGNPACAGSPAECKSPCLAPT